MDLHADLASHSEVDYLTLNDGVERELASICEVNFAGTVPQMQVTNNAYSFLME